MGSKSKSSTSTATNTQVSNLNFQNVGGPAIGEAGGDVIIVSTDQGSIQAAKEIALEGIYENARGLEELTDLSRDVVNVGGRIVEGGLGTAERLSLESFDLSRDLSAGISAFAETALDANQVLVQEGFDLSRDFLSEGAALIGEVIQSTQRGQQDFVTSISEIQARESTNNDARIGEIAKYGLIAAAVVAGAAVLRAR